ncbi:MAG: efflux RND transporter periplasmic adaptor subunit [Desulfobacterales bacterium]|nr:efflux RND transporter periplasmic adaptor subunit [Desulfobacterales bacterium]
MEFKKIEKSKKPAMVVLVSIIVSIIVLFAGVMGMGILSRMKTPPAEAKNGERPLKVEALQVEQEDILVLISGYGEVKALTVVPIAPEVAGKIVTIHPRLKAGEIIPKGEVLFKIDPTDYMIVLKTGRERLKILKRSQELAKKEHERVRVLLEKNSVGTQAGVEAAEKMILSAADLTSQIAQVLATAETNLKRCEVRAPFNARIKSVALEKGQYVTPGQNVVVLADDSVLEIQVPLDSRDAQRWLRFKKEKTEKATAWFSGLEKVPSIVRWTENNNGQTWEGRLHRVVKFDQQTRTLTVAVRVDAETATKKNPESLPLVEGMFCSVKIEGRTLHNVFRLPRQAVSFENTVYVVLDNRLKTVPVKVARVEGENVYISAGLHAGDTVVTTRLIDPLENTLLTIKSKQKRPS